MAALNMVFAQEDGPEVANSECLSGGHRGGAAACGAAAGATAASAPAASSPPAPHWQQSVLSIDVATRSNGYVIETIVHRPDLNSHPVLQGYTLRLQRMEVVDFLAEGAAQELDLLDMVSEDVNANKTKVDDLVVWMVRSMRPRLTAWLQQATGDDEAGPDHHVSPKEATVDLVLLEDQPMGNGWSGDKDKDGGGGNSGAAAQARQARNLRTKCLSHAIQAASIMVDPNTPVKFASTKLKAHDFLRLGRGEAADYADRKKMSVEWTRRLLMYTMRADGCKFEGWEEGRDSDDDFFEGLAANKSRGWKALAPKLPIQHPNTPFLQRLIAAGKHDDMTDAVLQGYYYVRRNMEEVRVEKVKAVAAQLKSAQKAELEWLKAQRAAIRIAKADAKAAGRRFDPAAVVLPPRPGTLTAAAGAPPPPPPGGSKALTALGKKLPKKAKAKGPTRESQLKVKVASVGAQAVGRMLMQGNMAKVAADCDESKDGKKQEKKKDPKAKATTADGSKRRRLLEGGEAVEADEVAKATEAPEPTEAASAACATTAGKKRKRASDEETPAKEVVVDKTSAGRPMKRARLPESLLASSTASAADDASSEMSAKRSLAASEPKSSSAAPATGGVKRRRPAKEGGDDSAANALPVSSSPAKRARLAAPLL